MTASRLYRSTPGLTRPLFTVTAAGKTYTDDSIHSITITHGKADPGGGMHPATAEVEVAGAVGVINNRDITVRLADAAATALAGTTAAGIRFTGRVATQRVTQRARRGKPARQATTVMASSWSSLYLGADRGPIVSATSSLADVLTTMFNDSVRWTGKAIPLSFVGVWGDWIYSGEYGSTFTEMIDQWFTEPGRLLRQRRDGGIEAMTLEARAARGETAAAEWWPITLGHAVSSTDHEQGTDLGNIGIQLRWREPGPNGWPDSTERSVNWAWPGSRDGVPASSVAEWKQYDWTHTVFTTEQYRHAINALSLQAFRVAYTTPALTIDLLALARSGTEYDRTMLAQVLNLQQGDPVILGGDWSSWWNGIYYAEQITERITPDEWTLELALYPPQEVTGHYGQGGSPAIPARIWSQAAGPWSADESRIWSDY